MGGLVSLAPQHWLGAALLALDGTRPVLAADATRTDRGAVVAAVKAGAIVPFSPLGPFPTVAVEAGILLPGYERSLGVLLDVSYSAPHAEGTEREAFDPGRVPGGEYRWRLTQKQLVLQPTLLWRFTGLNADPLTPYVGIGPRIYLLESVIEGSAAGEPFGSTPERSTKVGFGLPLGAELALGPGGLCAEVLLQWGPLPHRITGDSHLASGTMFVGYRARW